jgi:hypothetical protein
MPGAEIDRLSMDPREVTPDRVGAHVLRESGPTRERLVYERRRFGRLVQLIYRLPEWGGGG